MDKKSGYRVVIEDCMGVKEDESVLILTDDVKYNIGVSLFEESKKIAKESVLMIMETRSVSGEEPPDSVAESMKNFDVIICPTAVSLTHTNAKKNAVIKGARLGSMPGITEEMFEVGAIIADYKSVEELTMKFTDLLNTSKTAKIVKDRYILEMSLSNRKGVPSTGIYKNPGESGNLPSGEAYIAPVEGTVNGEIIIDGSMVGVGKLNSPLYVKIKDGVLKKLKGEDAHKLQVLFDNDENGTVAELGIGTNTAARLTGIILEDEKIYGTVHIAFGTNISFGGTNKAACHLDGIILNPTLYLDDKIVLKDGIALV